MTTRTQPTTLRAGIFNSLDEASRAVTGLLQAGFSAEQISVVCSNDAWQRHFREFNHQRPAGKNTPLAASTGAAVGATIGGLAAVAAGAATGGAALVFAGGAAAWTGGVLGGFLGAMLTRGVEKELADYYDQAVQEGKILVAAEAQGSHTGARLAAAEQALATAGAEPLPLRES
jgi:hypothetical protein